MQSDNSIHNSIHQLFTDRKSIRAFNPDKVVSKENLDAIFEAARWSFSSMNEQPWRYVVANKTSNLELWQKMFDTLSDGNKTWVVNAPVLILSLSKINFTKNDKPNSSYMHDLGSANMLMNLQAVNLGMQMHPMGGFSKEGVIEKLSIPNTLEPAVMFALGYQDANLESLNDYQKKNELERSSRYLIDELVFCKSF